MNPIYLQNNDLENNSAIKSVNKISISDLEMTNEDTNNKLTKTTNSNLEVTFSKDSQSL